MEAPRIIRKNAFKVIGYELRTTIREGRNFKEIPAFWERLGKEKRLGPFPGQKNPDTLLGICLDFDEEEGSFVYIIGAEVSGDDTLPDEMVLRMIPAATYAVFTCHGEIPSAIHKLVRHIYEEWMPLSEYKRGHAADFEVYDNRSSKGQDAEVDIFIPIEPK